MFIAPSAFTFLIAAYNAHPDSKAAANLVCRGQDDQVLINARLLKLPLAGGHVHFTEGTYVLSGVVAAEVDNVLLSGRGRATYFTRDGAAPCISAGTRTGWILRDLRTDAGGVDLSLSLESAATYWRDGGSYEVVGYPGISADAVLSDTGLRVKRIYVESGKLMIIYDDGV